MNCGLSERTMNSMKKIFDKYESIERVILYGSRAKGNYRNGSDIDITLHTDDTFTHTNLLRIAGDFDDSDIPYLVDISIYDKIDNEELKEHINRIGKVIYNKKTIPTALSHA